MAAHDLKHLFPEEEPSKKEDKLELAEELSFNVDNTNPKMKAPTPKDMEFENLPLEDLSLDNTSDLIIEILEKVDALYSNMDQKGYKKNVLQKGRILDHKVSQLLQKMLKTSPNEKANILAIKKLIVDFIKSVS